MIHRLLLCAGLLAALCGPAAAQQARRGQSPKDLSGLQKMIWTVGEDSREALVYVPPTTEANPPLVFIFHGHGGKAEHSAKKFAIHELWPEAVCVYPQGLPTAVPVIDTQGRMPGWQKYIGDQKDRDLAFFDAVLKSMKDEHRIDETRVYSTGHSNGGYFTYVLWAARGDVLAAVAPVAAAIDTRDLKLYKPKPVLHVAGEKDPIVRFQVQEQSIEQDRKINGTQEGAPPVLTYIHPGGHEVPDGAPRRIVDFFKSSAKK